MISDFIYVEKENEMVSPSRFLFWGNSKNIKKQPHCVWLLLIRVGAKGLEPSISCSQSRCPSHWATPRNFLEYTHLSFKASRGSITSNMKKREFAQQIYDILDNLLPKEIRFLEQRDPFRFLISVILSAQTTDKIVNVVVQELFSKYPDKQALAQADVQAVEEIIYPTGYYRNKAKNIVACAKALLGRTLPESMEELVKLPGVGRKTANCVLGEVYHKSAIIVDTHFARVVTRLRLVDDKDPEKIEKAVARLLDERYHYRFSMTANLFGRTVCHAKKPSCDACPLASLCPSKDAFLKKRSKQSTLPLV